MLDDVLMKYPDEETDYRELADPLQAEIGHIQREILDLKIPVMIIIEGWDASGISNICNRLIRYLDPRGYRLYPVGRPKQAEAEMPFFWRFALVTPEEGKFAIFDRAWYSRLIVENKGNIKDIFQRKIEDIKSFEHQFSDDGGILIKIFLHISHKEQKKRFKEADSDPCRSYYLKNIDWNPKKEYPEYFSVIDEILFRTNTPKAPWEVIPSENYEYAVYRVYDTVINRLKSAISEKREGVENICYECPLLSSGYCLPEPHAPMILDRKEYKSKKKELGKRLLELQVELYKNKIPLVVLYEGWDASGKGGAITRLTRYLNPRGYRIEPIGPPDVKEKERGYLWRFYNRLPRPGRIVIFDRTWYGRVLVERVEGLCSDYDWKRAYGEITEFEHFIDEWGAVIVKFWIHISKEEQLNRFRAREADPDKKWKITPEDWRNREKWDQYEEAVCDMISLTHTPCCPWTIVSGNDKYSARIQTFEAVIAAVEKKLKSLE